MHASRHIGSLKGPVPKACPFHKMLNAAREESDEVSVDQVADVVVKSADNPVQALQKLHRKFGKSFQIESDEGSFVFDSSPDAARDILLGTESIEPLFKKSEAQTHGLARSLGRENLLLATGDNWDSTRSALKDFFSFSQMKTDAMASRVSRTFDKHLKSAEEAVQRKGSAEVDLAPILKKATLDVALQKFFTKSCSEDELTELTEAYEVVNRRVGQEWLLPASITGLKEPSEEFEKSAGVIRGWAGKLVDERLKKKDGPEDVLGILMKTVDPDTNEPYSRERLVSEVQNLMLAGHETTANLIAWTLTQLARNPVQQNQLRSGITSAFGQDAPDVKTLKGMKKELSVWRQEAVEHPPNYLLAREALVDTQIGSDENPRDIKAGTTVLVSTAHANAGDSMFSFGAGRRFCLGFNMAQMETEIALVRFLQKFEISDTGERGVSSSLAQLPSDTTVTLKEAKLD